MRTERVFLIKHPLSLVQNLLPRYYSVNMGVVERLVSCSIGVVIHVVLSIELPTGSFLEQAMQ